MIWELKPTVLVIKVQTTKYADEDWKYLLILEITSKAKIIC